MDRDIECALQFIPVPLLSSYTKLWTLLPTDRNKSSQPIL